MKKPKWLSPEIIPAIHNRQIAEHGGLSGIREHGLLESALEKPKNLYHYSDPKPNLARLAASYAYGIARNHPFLDGNKRTAFVVCRLFLKKNGAELNAGQKEKYETFLRLAEGELTEEELAGWIETHLL